MSRQAEGTGIGLSLVKALVTVLEGKISVESEVGNGTNFIFTLPIKKIRRKHQ
ncbi:ATP-binding protein [Ruminiclostridium papyrosolvens]|uniref:ATP-binding protein n=1 Tax=Ruminiclostridium papyrosolvens TaxID=29362 RepID=UPI0003FCAA51|nr:ATP-binding protein [Ruminiclostridium papyrosolvens]